ncbi:MAG TPA: hypothetical protein VHD56_06410 [Tepidisphaeraceae bacterium]|nr:hypothetical protein [Tepidisphaeraceae bacterium]
MRNLATLTAIVALFTMAGVAQAGISGSKHDFGSLGWSQNQICLPCHTPHNAIVKDGNGVEVGGPLWNHTLSTATYTLYLDANGQGVTGQVDTNSKLCLSCHDGTVALDSFGGATGNTNIAGKANLGNDLSNDHPIGEAAIWPTPNPSYMVDPTLRANASGGAIMPLRALADGRQTVGCTSCHEPHNRKSTTHMLWVNNGVAGTTVDGRAVSGSLLCLNCHKK